MEPIEFPESNTIFVADGCCNLPAHRKLNEQFKQCEVISCWELSDEDCIEILKQIKDGHRPAIYLSVIGGQPPVSLFLRSVTNGIE